MFSFPRIIPEEVGGCGLDRAKAPNIESGGSCAVCWWLREIVGLLCVCELHKSEDAHKNQSDVWRRMSSASFLSCLARGPISSSGGLLITEKGKNLVPKSVHVGRHINRHYVTAVFYRLLNTALTQEFCIQCTSAKPNFFMHFLYYHSWTCDALEGLVKPMTSMI